LRIPSGLPMTGQYAGSVGRFGIAPQAGGRGYLLSDRFRAVCTVRNAVPGFLQDGVSLCCWVLSGSFLWWPPFSTTRHVVGIRLATKRLTGLTAESVSLLMEQSS
jgi:hypothetical protein